MDIQRIEIERYKNLRGCRLDLAACGRLAVLAGINGSGKSNFLEAISLLFHRLFNFGSSHYIECDCRLKCELSNKSYDIEQKDNDIWVNGVRNDHSNKFDGRLVVMYSGEFDRFSSLGFSNDKDNFSPSKNIVYVSADSFVPLLLTKILRERHGKVKSTIKPLITLPEVYKIRLSVNPYGFNYEDAPYDEIEEMLRRLYERSGRGYDSSLEMTLDEFEEEIRKSIPDWDKLDSPTMYYLLSDMMADYDKTPGLQGVEIGLRNSCGAEFSSYDLSEGEKWLVMYEVIFSSLSDKNTLVLLDEPDAYIHEAKKCQFVHYLEQYSLEGIFTVITTHSPVIINTVNDNSLFGFMRDKNGFSKIANSRDRALACGLVDDRMHYFSNKPIVLFEGISDVKLATGALRYFANNIVEFAELRYRTDLDFFAMGSAGNSIAAYECFRRAFPARRIYVVLDHDNAGREAYEKFKAGCAADTSILSEGDRAFLLPKPDGFDETEDTYVMEDYLPKEFIQDKLEQYKNEATCFHKVNNSYKSLKTEIFKNCNRFTDREWIGFRPLVDFLMNLPT